MRREVEFFNEPQAKDRENSSGMRLTVTRKGVEIVGWYDHFIGIQPFDISWEAIDAARADVNTPRRADARFSDPAGKP